jgi:hypothetical protein
LIKSSIDKFLRIDNRFVKSVAKLGPRFGINAIPSKRGLAFSSVALPKSESKTPVVIDFSETGQNAKVFSHSYFEFNEKRVPSVAGYVPYVGDQTTIIIYNFFSVNYGIRKQFAGAVHLLKGDEVKGTVLFTLPSYGVVNLDLTNVFGISDGDIVLVELFHPRIKKNHGGQSGHLRYWGIYGKHSAIVHSMPYPKGLISSVDYHSCRRIFPHFSRHDGYLWGEVSQKRSCYRSPGLSKKARLAPDGFNIIQRTTNDSDKLTTAVWHDAKLGIGDLSLESANQLVALPPIADLDVLIAFGEYLSKPSEIYFCLLSTENEVLEENSLNVEPDDQIRASALFKKSSIERSDFILVKSLTPDCRPGISDYLHLFYLIGNKVCDCVHSHASLIRVPDDDQDIPSRASTFGRHQALKFAYFPNLSEFDFYLSIWTESYEIEAKLRIILENQKEILFNLLITPCGVKCIHVNPMCLQGGMPANSSGVIQFESSQSNLNATSFIYSPCNSTLAIDHLTGG